MIKTACIISASLLALATAAPASATLVTDTFFGFVAPDDLSGQDMDVANLFGGGNLAFLPVVATVTLDTTLGVEMTDGLSFDEIDGGPDYGANPITSVSYLINGHTYSYQPDQFQDVTTQAPITGVTPGFYSVTAYDTADDQSLIQIVTASASSSLSSSFVSEADPGTIGEVYTYFNPGQTNTGLLDTITFDTLAVDVVAAAPEPDSWLLMILGLGTVGGALRWGRRRRLTPARA